MSSKTKILILNNPHNPTGKVFTNEELQDLALLCLKNDFYIISDEVYEYITYDDCAHIPTACIKDLKDRVLTISSIGKTLSLTGWKIGWALGPKHLISAMHKLHQFVTFCVATPLQDAVAKALPMMSTYNEELKNDYQNKRNFLAKGLAECGHEVLIPKGSYFLLSKVPEHFNSWDYALKLIKENKVATIPVSGFYHESDDGKRYVRFCFAKKDQTLMKALENLRGRY